MRDLPKLVFTIVAVFVGIVLGVFLIQRMEANLLRDREIRRAAPAVYTAVMACGKGAASALAAGVARFDDVEFVACLRGMGFEIEGTR